MNRPFDASTASLALCSQALAIASIARDLEFGLRDKSAAEHAGREHPQLAAGLRAEPERLRKVAGVRIGLVTAAAIGTIVQALAGPEVGSSAAATWILASGAAATLAGVDAWRCRLALDDVRARRRRLKALEASLPAGRRGDPQTVRRFIEFERHRLVRLEALMRVQLAGHLTGIGAEGAGIAALFGLIVGTTAPLLGGVGLPLGALSGATGLLASRMRAAARNDLDDEVQLLLTRMGAAARRSSSQDRWIGPRLIEGYFGVPRRAFRKSESARTAMKLHLGPLSPRPRAESTRPRVESTRPRAESTRPRAESTRPRAEVVVGRSKRHGVDA